MGAERHLIARQTIEIVSTDRAAAEALSVRTGQAADRLAWAIERSLDTVEAAGLDLRIDRIEIDLGACDPARWEDALADGIRDTLAAKVAEAVDRGEALHRDPGAAALALLSEFARAGRLPWWAAASDRPESAIALLASAGCDPAGVHAILARPGAAERFVNQLRTRSLASLVRLARPTLFDDEAAISAFVEALSTTAPVAGSSSPVGVAAVWRAVLTEAALGRSASGYLGPSSPRESSAAFDRFREAVAGRLGIAARPGGKLDEPDAARTGPASEKSPAEVPRRSEERVRSLAERLRALASTHPSAAALYDGLAALAPKLNPRIAQAVEALLDGGGATDLPALVRIFAEAGVIGAEEVEPWRDLVTATRTHAGDEAHDAVSVANAGLVLLWPFLPRFFAGLGLIEDEQFRDVAAQHRAAALLYYLASGDSAGPEHELPLAKVLAGVEIDAIHDPGQPLEPFETGSADELLEAVLGHAPMLGRISVGGLREAFLMRPGVLATRDGHWLLHVERRSIDILLDRLPWTCAWVRLSWMDEPLQVEW